MKVLFLMTDPFGVGGVQSDMLILGSGLSAMGHEVHLATVAGQLQHELNSEGVRFHPLDFRFRGPLGLWRAAIRLRRLVVDQQIELLAPQSVRSSMVSYLALRLLPFGYRVAATGQPLPIVTTIHNIHNPTHFRYVGWILRRCCDFVIFESHYERDRVSAGGLPAGMSELVYSGVDTERFVPLPPDLEIAARYSLDPTRHRVFGIVARLSEEKGHDYLLQAFAGLAAEYPQARLMIVGDGPLLEPVRAHCAALGLEKVVIFTGMQREIPRFLSLIDVFVLSSTRESFPRAAREAMAAGKAVVAPDIGGCPEVVADGETGLLFPAADAAALGARMRAMLAEDRVTRFGEAARRRVIERFSKADWVREYDRIYRQYAAELPQASTRSR